MAYHDGALSAVEAPFITFDEFKADTWLEEINRYSWSLNAPKIILSALLLVVSLALTPSGWVLVCRSMGSDIPRGQLFAAWYGSQLGVVKSHPHQPLEWLLSPQI